MLPQNTKQLLHATLLLCLNTNLIGMESTSNTDTLISNPIQSLNIIHTAFNMFIKELNSPKKPVQLDLTTQTNNYKSLIQKYEQICPLFLLDECTKEENNTETNNNCLLSRTYKPQFRTAFEEHTSQLLINTLQTSPTKRVTYTSFASGGIFQDLIIITKALIKQPSAQLSIHFIDGNNTPYVSVVDFLNYSREITADDTFFNFGLQLAEYEQYARNKEKNDPEIMAMTNTALQQQLTFLCVEKEAQYKQFIRSLTQKFSLAKICLYIHDRVNNYCNFLEKNNLAHADILTTADIDDDRSIRMGSYNDYAMLCIKTLKNNPTANTAWLKKDNDNSVGICTACLPDVNKPHEIEFDFKDL